jgi:signal transduction histidine kinase
VALRTPLNTIIGFSDLILESGTGALNPQQGSGLGLALCRKFVEMHGGTIGADSVYGNGTALWFLLSAERPMRWAIRTAGVTIL